MIKPCIKDTTLKYHLSGDMTGFGFVLIQCSIIFLYIENKFCVWQTIIFLQHR